MAAGLLTLSNQDLSRILDLVRETLRSYPDPSVTLVGKRWKSPYLVLISCLLSLRTKDETTLPASERLFHLADNPSAMVKLKVNAIEKAIFPVGFYRTKAQRILDISRVLLEQFHGQVPASLDTLLTFKGVGRKTANLVMTEGFHQPAMCVDTHVHRISNRFGYVKTATPDATEQVLRGKLPAEFWGEYNALLVLWGQNICRPLSPKCSECPVANLCHKVGVKRRR